MAETVDTILVRVEADLKDVNAKLKQLERNTKKPQTALIKDLTALPRVRRHL